MNEMWVEVMESFQGDEIMVTVTRGERVLRRRLAMQLVQADPELIKRTADTLCTELQQEVVDEPG